VSALTHENTATQLLSEQKLDQALSEAEAAIAVAPDRPISHVTRGRILLAMGKNTEADEELRKADVIANMILARQ
jgi:Tfp pilus assembly protein PilF